MNTITRIAAALFALFFLTTNTVLAAEPTTGSKGTLQVYDEGILISGAGSAGLNCVGSGITCDRDPMNGLRVRIRITGGGGGGVTGPNSSTNGNLASFNGTDGQTLADSGAAAANVPSTGQKAALAGTSGTPGVGNEYVTTNDSRMTNARTPTAHASSHAAAGTDPLTLSSSQVSGLAAIATSGSASDLGTGTVPYARLPVGTTSNTVLAGNTSFYNTVIDDTGSLTLRSELAMLGNGVTCTDNNSRTECQIPGGITTLGIGGSSQNLRGRLNLIAGSNLSISNSDNSGSNSSDVTIAVTAPGSSQNVLYNSGGSIAALSAGLAGQSLRLSASGALQWSSMPQTPQIAGLVEEWYTATGQNVWTNQTAGTGAAVAANASITDSTHPGAITFSSGTTNSGQARAVLALTSHKVASASQNFYMEAVIYLNALSTGTDRYNFTAGLQDATGAGRPANGIFFEYQDDRNSGAMACCVCASSVCSCTTGGTVPTAQVWERWGISISGGVLTCLRNDVSTGTLNSGFPLSTTAMGPMLELEKTVGTTAVTVGADRFAIALFTPTR